MSPFTILCFLTVLCAAASSGTESQEAIHSSSRNSLNNKWKPTEWLTVSELENLPAAGETSLKQVENMAIEDAELILCRLYHLMQLSRDIKQTWKPDVENIPSYIVAPNGEKVSFQLNQLVYTLKQLPFFGNQELTIYITGLPEIRSLATKKANRQLIEAYWHRYHSQQQNNNSNEQREEVDCSEKAQEKQQQQNQRCKQNSTGNLLVIDFGATLHYFMEWIELDIEGIGNDIAKRLVQLTNEADVARETIHLIGYGIAAHVAGATARQYTRQTGHKLRRATGLDPSKIFSATPNYLVGLARGVAEVVDAIHTSTDGFGTDQRVGNVDFYPNGPYASMPGAENTVESSLRAVYYFAESVYPGNERNFPAVAANSLEDFKTLNAHGQRNYMGISTDFNVEGDYILQVNPGSPFGKGAVDKN